MKQWQFFLSYFLSQYRKNCVKKQCRQYMLHLTHLLERDFFFLCERIGHNDRGL